MPRRASARRPAEVDYEAGERYNKNGVRLRGTGVTPGGGGLRSSYDPDYHPQQAFKFALLGLDDAKIAEAFGIAHATLVEWIADYTALASSLKAGKAEADSEVSFSLYNQARGYKKKVTKVFYNAKIDKVVEHVIEEEVDAKSESTKFWLYNRQRHLWQNRVDTTLTDADGKTIQPPSIVVEVAAVSRKKNEEN
jgi:hypothetical protein